MDPFKFSCPHCSYHVTATPEWYGKMADCPHCSQRFEVPYPEPIQARFGTLPEEGALPTVIMHRAPSRPRPNPAIGGSHAKKEASPARSPESAPPKKPWWKFW